MGACAADYDNDDRVDLFVTNLGPDVLYHNDGHGAFTDVTRRAGVGSNLLGASCAFADIDNVFADYDRDGRVDLFVANDLTRNFLYHKATACSKRWGFLPASRSRATGACGQAWEPTSATTTATASSTSS